MTQSILCKTSWTRPSSSTEGDGAKHSASVALEYQK